MSAKTAYDLANVIREMATAHNCLCSLPEVPRWTQRDLHRLDDVRHQALRLAEVAEQLIEESRLTG